MEEGAVPIGFGGCMYIILHGIHADILRLSEHAATVASNLYTMRCRDIPKTLRFAPRNNPPTHLSKPPLRTSEKAPLDRVIR